mmetsp:Transcript_14958/g.26043  ORF Transcript_14958/g.26043 Transcript_14958/m.26043 type:complete len:288 (-) Transcript_14958:453-1316(-)
MAVSLSLIAYLPLSGSDSTTATTTFPPLGDLAACAALTILPPTASQTVCVHTCTSTFPADLLCSVSGTYATMASCLVPAEKIILPTWPEQPLRSSASGSGSEFIASIAVRSRSVSPSGVSIVVQKKSRPPMSDAPSISTPFLPPSLMTALRSLSFALAASLAALAASSSFGSSFFGSSFFGLASSFFASFCCGLASLGAFSFFSLAGFSALVGEGAGTESPISSVDCPSTARNSGWLMHVLNHRTSEGKGATKAASMTSLKGLSRHMETTTSAAVTACPTRKVECSR